MLVAPPKPPPTVSEESVDGLMRAPEPEPEIEDEVVVKGRMRMPEPEERVRGDFTSPAELDGE